MTRALLVLLALVLLGSLLMPSARAAEPAPRPFDVRLASPTRLEFDLHVENTGDLFIASLLPFEEFEGRARTIPVPAQVGSFGVDLPQGAPDPVYFKYALLSSATREQVGEAQFITDLSALEPRDFPFLEPGTIKGITCPVDLEDVKALGTRHINTNVNIPWMVDFDNPNPTVVKEALGVNVAINVGYIEGLDSQIKPYSDAGMDVVVVLNNPVPKSAEDAHIFVHPLTDLARAPNGLGAFNVTTRESAAAYIAAMEYMAERYSRPDAAHGWISGYIVGNELNSHWYWYNMGEISMEDFTDDYLVALRLADLAVRRVHSRIKTYISLEHHWTVAFSFNRKQAFAARPVHDKGNRRGTDQGNFPWHVAFHPYPENLFDPRFWEDKQAVMAFDTPKITFKNQEVLPAYLSQPQFLWDGALRSIIYSEQGFHAGKTEQERLDQAAAYALAYFQVSHTPGIDAFHLHRHVSHPREGGLLLGTRDFADGDPHKLGPKYPLYDVFQAAGTERQEEAFAFALGHIGLASWEDARPVPFDQIPAVTPGREGLDTPEDALVADLCSLFGEGRAEDVGNLAVRGELAARNGVFMEAIFQHPPQEGHGDLVFALELPAVEEGHKLVLDFATSIIGDTDDGVRYAVLVDGEELWAADVLDRTVDVHQVDLAPFAGKVVKLSLRVHGRENIQHDWSTWVRPQVIRQ